MSATKQALPLSHLYVAIVEWAGRQGAVSIKDLPGCWHGKLGKREIAINGHSEPVKLDGGGDAPPYSAVVTHNGWPEAIVGPSGGAVVNASEADLIALFENDALREMQR